MTYPNPEEWNECVTNSSYQRSTITQSRGCLRTVKLVMITMVRRDAMSFDYCVSRWPIWHSISPDCLDRKLVTSVLIVLAFWELWEYLSLTYLSLGIVEQQQPTRTGVCSSPHMNRVTASFLWFTRTWGLCWSRWFRAFPHTPCDCWSSVALRVKEICFFLHVYHPNKYKTLLLDAMPIERGDAITIKGAFKQCVTITGSMSTQ